MITAIKLYFLVSIIIGIFDGIRIKRMHNEMATYPVGDVGYYVMPKKIIGIHNAVFWPSLLTIGLLTFIVNVKNRLL